MERKAPMALDPGECRAEGQSYLMCNTETSLRKDREDVLKSVVKRAVHMCLRFIFLLKQT